MFTCIMGENILFYRELQGILQALFQFIFQPLSTLALF